MSDRRPPPLGTRDVIPQPGATLTPMYWSVWGLIAVEHEWHAEQARKAMLREYEQTHRYYFEAEWYPSVVAIAASAFALDAWYGAVVNRLPVRPSNRGRPKRSRRVLETLKLGFRLGRKGEEWLPELDWLFAEQRDGLVHPPWRADVPVPIDGIDGLYHSPIHNDQSPAGAVRAVDLMIDVLDTCIENPRAKYPDLVELTRDCRFCAGDLIKRRWKGAPFY